jgi:hypothetical protein
MSSVEETLMKREREASPMLTGNDMPHVGLGTAEERYHRSGIPSKRKRGQGIVVQYAARAGRLLQVWRLSRTHYWALSLYLVPM